MFLDARSPYQKAQDDKRCPTCGHRPADVIDEAKGFDSGGYNVKVCPQCSGTGYAKLALNIAPCDWCKGTGRVIETY